LSANLSHETFVTLYIAIMTGNGIDKRFQIIVLWCFKNKKVLQFNSGDTASFC